MAHSLEALNRHVRACIVVFLCLLVLTMLTVFVSYMHVPVTATVVIALSIAVTKGSLVGAYFMHLIDEKKIIYASLTVTAFFALAMMVLIYAQDSDPIRIMIQRAH